MSALLLLVLMPRLCLGGTPAGEDTEAPLSERAGETERDDDCDFEPSVAKPSPSVRSVSLGSFFTEKNRVCTLGPTSFLTLPNEVGFGGFGGVLGVVLT